MSLAAEAVIIRNEERKAKGDQRASLHDHRTGILRREARASYLAYGYLRGRAYAKIERAGSRPPDLKNVHKIADRFNPEGRGKITEADIDAWANAPAGVAEEPVQDAAE